MVNQIIAGLGGIVVFGLIVRFQQTRINKLQDQKQDRRACDQLMLVFKEDLERGSKRFDKIDDTLKELGETVVNTDKSLALIEQSVSFLAQKNGYKQE